jgi:hypothetical protein
MKKIALFIVIFSFYSTTQAGLFEYYLGVDTPSNSSSSAEAVETIEQYVAPKSSIYIPTYSSNSYSNYSNNYNSSYGYYNSCQDWTL